MKLKLGGIAASRPTDTDFNAQVTRLKEAGCDLVCMGTIVRDTIIILQTAHKMGWVWISAVSCSNGHQNKASPRPEPS